MPARRLLVLAGHDPTGGAGVDADREAALAQGVIADCIVTAETDQDGVQVLAIRPRAALEWLAEAEAWMRENASDGRAVVKTGLLPGAEHVRALVRLRERLPELTLVVDPVLAASAGETFLDDAGIEALLDELLPLGPVLTPNLPELARLASCSVDELRELDRRVARGTELLERGALAVLIKGGHGQEDPVRDLVLARARAPVWHAHARVPGASLHGSGCRYASCVAAELAKGSELAAAAAVAGRTLLALIAASTLRENS